MSAKCQKPNTPFTKLLCNLSRCSPPPTGKLVATALNSERLAPVAVLSVEHGTVAKRSKEELT